MKKLTLSLLMFSLAMPYIQAVVKDDLHKKAMKLREEKRHQLAIQDELDEKANEILIENAKLKAQMIIMLAKLKEQQEMKKLKEQ